MRKLSLFLLSSFVLCSVAPWLRADESNDLKQLVADLRGNESVKKRKAVKQIASLGITAKSAVPALISILEKDRDALVRQGAAEALGNIGGDAKSTIPALSKALKDSNEDVIAMASVSLSKYGKQAVPTLQKALSDSDNQVRRYAANAIAKIGPDAKDAVPALIKAFQSEPAPQRRTNNTVKAGYVEALAAIGPDAKEVLPIFEAILKETRNPDRELRRLITNAVTKIKK